MMCFWVGLVTVKTLMLFYKVMTVKRHPPDSYDEYEASLYEQE